MEKMSLGSRGKDITETLCKLGRKSALVGIDNLQFNYLMSTDNYFLSKVTTESVSKN
jgi:hypothetical protein